MIDIKTCYIVIYEHNYFHLIQFVFIPIIVLDPTLSFFVIICNSVTTNRHLFQDSLELFLITKQEHRTRHYITACGKHTTTRKANNEAVRKPCTAYEA